MYHGNRLDLIVSANTARSLLAQARANSICISKYERFTPAPAYYGVEQDCLKEREAKGVGSESNSPPRVRGNQIQRS